MTNEQIILNEAAKLDPATLHAIATAHHTPEQIAAICEQVKRYTVTRYIAPGRQIIVAPSTRTPGGWQVTFYHADRQTGELVPIGHADRDTAAGVADEIPYNYIAADAVA